MRKTIFNKPFKIIRKATAIMTGAAMLAGIASAIVPANNAVAKDDVIKLRVCNWEEYIDLGDWDEEELIELDNGSEIIGVNAMYDDFEEWYFETYGQKVEVEYSCFGTNEDLYNQLTLGDTYDLVCPSDYMLMKLIAEDKAQPFSDEFFDTNDEYNYYVNGVSPYIKDVFDNFLIGDEAWSKYAACYMWGITGVLYNPEYMTDEEAATWSVFNNPKFYRQVTLKDNVRDTYFAMLGYLKAKKLMSDEFIKGANYHDRLFDEMNDVTPETINQVETLLQETMGNVYALETDSGKADMVTGKVVANYQWSGDAVYAMDLADEDGVELRFAVPEECTNLWFDGWIMLKDGIDGDADRQHAAEAFVNYLSRPDNAVRNMYYIGYTSAIGGGKDTTVFDYLNWCYADEDEEDTIEYPVGYFFSGDNDDEDYIVYADAEQIGRQLTSQYPDKATIDRTAIMGYYDEEQTKNINQMWINVRCFNIKNVKLSTWLLIAAAALVIVGLFTMKAKKNK